MKNLRTLPKTRDSWSYLYVDRCRVDQDQKAIAIHDARGKVSVPCASLGLLLMGPGASITHAAIHTLAENGCMVGWTGEGGVRFYAAGMGETRFARNILHQAATWADPTTRMETIVRMYRMRFNEEVPAVSLQQLRGREGLRVRAAYQAASRASGVPWRGRAYRSNDWARADPVNRALSAANSCLYGICHAAIVAAGYSSAIGFIHTGRSLSFVYDVADLFKTETAIPAAFAAAAEGPENIETRVRTTLRDHFHRSRIMERLVPSIARALGDDPQTVRQLEASIAGIDDAIFTPGWLFDPAGPIEGGQAWSADATPEHDVGDEAE
jgi:CRISP-associated protein Cas1